MATLSDILRERGYVYQHSSETLEEITDGEKRTLYWGTDPSADSLHIGQLQGILIMRRFIEAGHKVIILVGGGTGMIGDPGGKSQERNLLTGEEVARNATALRMQFSQLFGTEDFTMVNNAEWLHPLNMMEFLRDVGKHFTVNEMIKRDSVRPRITEPDKSISFTEFSYMLLQAYDYLHLHTVSACDLQVGGSDQWGNIVSGVDLIRRKTGDTAHALSWPLLVDKKTGKKFGKSENGAVWLDPAKTSPFAFYQFWLNVDDDAVGELLLKMTLLPKDEIDRVMSKHTKSPGVRTAQRALAQAVTTLVHGDDAAVQAALASDALFGASTLDELDDDTLTMLRNEAPTCAVMTDEPIEDVLVRSALASSKREARQFITDGAITLNGMAIIEARSLADADFVRSVALLKRGKRSVVVLTRTQ